MRLVMFRYNYMLCVFFPSSARSGSNWESICAFNAMSDKPMTQRSNFGSQWNPAWNKKKLLQFYINKIDLLYFPCCARAQPFTRFHRSQECRVCIHWILAHEICCCFFAHKHTERFEFLICAMLKCEQKLIKTTSNRISMNIKFKIILFMSLLECASKKIIGNTAQFMNQQRDHDQMKEKSKI